MNITKEQAKKHLSNLIDNLLDSEETHYSEHFNIDYEKVDLTATEDLQEHNYKDLRVLQDYLNQDDYEEKAKREEITQSILWEYISKNDIEELIELKIQKEKEKLVSECVDEGIKVQKGRWGRSIISSGKKKVEIPKELEIFRKDLTTMHNLKSD